MATADDPKVKLTYDHYALFPTDGMRHEIINGRHYVNPAPSPQHQTISRRIQFQIYQQIEIAGFGQVFNAPIDLQLSETDVVQPDIVVVMNDNPIITETRILGVADLVIEILSPSNRQYDLQLKKTLYQQAGIREYWIVDGPNRTVQKNLLNSDGDYEFSQHDKEITCSELKIVVDLESVWL